MPKNRDMKPLLDRKIATVMKEFEQGNLKSSSGDKVTDRKQALAIALSEMRKLKKQLVRAK